jgi:4-amino-4-deoxy-L-arabinose transferase-like glycosyltransferase
MLPKLKELKEWQTVLLLTVVGFAYRGLHFVLFANMIIPEHDATRNIMLGRNFASGNLYGVLDDYWPPLYPILLGIMTYVVNDLVLPAIIISTVAGSLAIPLTYYFVKRSYSRREAVIAAVIAIFSPYLINSVFALGSENIYLLCILGALITGWKGWVKGSAIYYFVTGILLGLAYLTRPEAIGYPIFFIALAIAKSLWQKLPARKMLVQIAAVFIGFALLSTPYILYLRSETGSWTISGKTRQNLASGIFSEEVTQRETDQFGSEPRTEGPTVKAIVVNFIENMREVQGGIVQLFPILLLVLAGLGIFGERWGKDRLIRETYLLTFCVLTVAGYAATWVLERYLYVLLPIFFGWIALGVVRLEKWFRESAPSWTYGRYLSRVTYGTFAAGCLTLIFLYLFTSNFYVRSKESEWQGRAYEERDAGIWLRENGKASPAIFSASFRPVFYANGKQYWERAKDIGEILEQIRNAHADYVVDGERTHRQSPYLKDLTEILQNDPDYELVYQRNDHPGHKISIFRRK